MNLDPRAAAHAAAERAATFDGQHEHFAGFGVMALPFSTGHVLALRCWPATTIGPPYASVSVRSPDGAWVIQTDAPPERSCPRYFSAAAAEIPAPQPIEVTWSGPGTLTVTIEDELEWHLALRSTAATRLMSACAAAMSTRWWSDARVLSVMATAAGPLLGSGRVALQGTAPNGQWFRAAPRHMWLVASSSARWRGLDLGSPAPLDRQAHLAQVPMPQRGIFFVGTAVFETFDPARHVGPLDEMTGTPRQLA
ncbi:hypothetical protein [Georgenia satyanarayanai]|uniref:hypothetical protein n=1 Tax=Georgenia satyanarayanai TaxID=860221 RepID=UPI001264D77E|nr:hypothetical protein [Georgenia satyanarayanai]